VVIIKLMPKEKKTITPPTTPAVARFLADITRKYKGVNGDLDRLPMLTWIMFLKFLDDLEIQREEEAKRCFKTFAQQLQPCFGTVE
jgi:type I restriction enzyme M protein